MNQTYIVLKHSDPVAILTTLQDFANLYSTQEFAAGIELYKGQSDSYVIVPHGIDEEHFMYAVNYLRYPESKATFSVVLGYNDNTNRMYFVPTSDNEYDNCYSVDRSGEKLKHIFDGSSVRSEVSQEYIESYIEFDSLNKIETIVGVKKVPKKISKKGFFSWFFGRS